MSMSTGSCPLMYFPDCYGKADCLYILENSEFKKKPLSLLQVNSISFYTTYSAPTDPNGMPSPVAPNCTSVCSTCPSLSDIISTPVYLCSVYNVGGTAGVGTITWNLSSSCFNGIVNILLKIRLTCGECIYAFVQCTISGLLQSQGSSYVVSTVYPIVLTSNLNVFNIDTTTSPPSLVSFPETMETMIKCSLYGYVEIQFPSSDLNTWLFKNQYFSVTYRQPMTHEKRCSF